MKANDLKRIERVLQKRWNLTNKLKGIKKFKDKSGVTQYYADYKSDLPKEKRVFNKKYLKFKLKVAKSLEY